ncbi:MAG TPA: ATP-binding protein [Roseiflexaceae bacterium]|nr:ATP-binding protein [Roseiflexaceae bacterium]
MPENTTNNYLSDPSRLRTLRELALLDRSVHPVCDRYTRLTAKLLRAPSALIALVDSERQLFTSGVGVPEPWATRRETPLLHSFCQHIIAGRAPLVVPDAHTHPLLQGNLGGAELGIGAYLGVPLCAPDGHVIGALCAIDRTPRAWTGDELEALRDLATSLVAEITLHRHLAERSRSEQLQAAQRRCYEAVVTEQSLASALAALADGLATVFGGGCAIALLPEDGDGARVAASAALPAPQLAEGVAAVLAALRAREAAVLAGQVVLEADIAADADWEGARAHALACGLRWCWTVPFRGAHGQLHGAIALFFPAARAVSVRDREDLGDAARAAGIAVEHWRAHQALLAGEARYLAVSALTSDYAYSLRIEPDGRIVTEWATDAYARIMDYTPAEIDARGGFRTIVHPDDRASAEERARRVLANQPDVRELRIVTKRGAVRWLRAFTQPEWDAAQGRVVRVVGSMQDITAQKEAEESRVALERQLQDTQRLESIGLLAGGIAHDFNNLLAAILGNAGMALLDVMPSSPAYESLRQIEIATQRAASLTQQLLAYAGKGRFVIQPLDLNTLVVEMARLLKAALPHPVPIRYHLAAGLPLIEADEAQIRQVVMNLIVNAAEAVGGPDGSIAVTTRGDGRLPDGRPAVVLEIEDTGCGMDEGTLARIFEPFFTTKFTGRGLGLAAVQGIVRGHQGVLAVRSAVGAGTTFTVSFPAVAPAPRLVAGDPAAEAGRRPDAPQPANEEGASKRTVLVIDDEPGVRQIAARLLERQGYAVLAAGDGHTGVEIARAHPGPVAAALVDWTMPGMSGADVARALAAARPDIRIVIMSGYNAEEIRKHLDPAMVAGFLQKPFRPQDLHDVLERTGV